MNLKQIKRTDNRILQNMDIHYSHPKGFVGRNICYAILYNDIYYGSIVGGSATLHLVGRDSFFNLTKDNKKEKLKNIINNIFFHMEKVNGEYPVRNMSVKILELFRKQIIQTHG